MKIHYYLSIFLSIALNFISVVSAQFNSSSRTNNTGISNTSVSVSPLTNNIDQALYGYFQNGTIQNAPLALLSAITINLTTVEAMIDYRMVLPDGQKLKREDAGDMVAYSIGFLNYDTLQWIAKLNDTVLDEDNDRPDFSTVIRLNPRSTCGSWFWKNFYSLIWLASKAGELKVWVKENTYTFVVDMISSWANNVNIPGSCVKHGSIKETLNGGLMWISINEGDTNIAYEVGWAPWTTGKNCDNTASADSIADITQWAIQQASQKSLLSWCQRYTNGGTWRADVRFLRWEYGKYSYQKLWSIPCGSN